jgi:surface polysaccharide O-acyltransferase-like enzyme
MTQVSLSNLRAFVIFVVVAFHSCLAYLASAPAPTAFNRPPYTWQAFPIVDAHRSIFFDVFCAWQDVSLMALMFLLSGLLTPGSLRRKKAATYIYDRLFRIGLPFSLAVMFLSPLSFYPAYLARTENASLSGFWSQWSSLPSWPEGPQWFLWLLLVFNALAALLYAINPRYLDFLGRVATWLTKRPWRLIAILAATSAVVYVPMAIAFSPWQWTAFGPFSLQICRPALYVVFFFTGVCLGSAGLDHRCLKRAEPLARSWVVVLIAACVTFGIWAGFTGSAFPDWATASTLAKVGASLSFPLACATGGVFLLAVFLRFAGSLRMRPIDSLSENAYSIYLVHYVFVVWLQYALLNMDLFAAAKVLSVLLPALALSWATSVALTRLLGTLPPMTKRLALRARA